MAKGHVPDEHLPRYRQLREISMTLDSLGGRASGFGMYAEANELWAVSGKWRRKADELRMDMADDRHKRILKHGPSHPDHPDHVHEDCCK